MDRRSILRGMLGLGGAALVACMAPPAAEAMPAEKLPPSSPDVEPTAMAAGDGVASPTEEQDYWVVYRRRRFRRRVYWRRRRVIWRRRYWRRRYYW